MHSRERGRGLLQAVRELASRSAWEWRRCPSCGEHLTGTWGGYTRRPWFFEGRREVRGQRHRCQRCRRTSSERSALRVRGGWYAREVRRCAIDPWPHVGSSLRRTAALLRSWLGRQERWRLWRPLAAPPPEGARCRRSASTVQRWLDGAGRQARRTVADHLAGVPTSGQVGTDGLWARLRGGSRRVVRLLVDHVSGLRWPQVVVAGEEATQPGGRLFRRARAAGLAPAERRGVASDGARGLLGYLERGLGWVNPQRGVFHLWRPLGGELARRVGEAAAGLGGEAAARAREQARRELVALVRGVLDARGAAQAAEALARLAAHRLGAGLARALEEHVDAALVHLKRDNQGLLRVAPAGCWRDFRLRLSHGRNHGSPARLERAALLWALYRNFTPAQGRSERKRHYRRPGLSPLEMAGVPPGQISDLDALSV